MAKMKLINARVAVIECILSVTFLISTESSFLPHFYQALDNLGFLAVSNTKVASPIQRSLFICVQKRS